MELFVIIEFSVRCFIFILTEKQSRRKSLLALFYVIHTSLIVISILRFKNRYLE